MSITSHYNGVTAASYPRSEPSESAGAQGAGLNQDATNLLDPTPGRIELNNSKSFVQIGALIVRVIKQAGSAQRLQGSTAQPPQDRIVKGLESVTTSNQHQASEQQNIDSLSASDRLPEFGVHFNPVAHASPMSTKPYILNFLMTQPDGSATLGELADQLLQNEMFCYCNPRSNRGVVINRMRFEISQHPEIFCLSTEQDTRESLVASLTKAVKVLS